MDQNNQLIEFITEELSNLKANEIIILDVQGQTAMTDYMIIASGTSTQHVRSIASNLATESKKNQHKVFGCEGLDSGEWVLVDLGDALVHVMLPQVREYYQIEKLWSVEQPQCESN